MYETLSQILTGTSQQIRLSFIKNLSQNPTKKIWHERGQLQSIKCFDEGFTFQRLAEVSNFAFGRINLYHSVPVAERGESESELHNFLVMSDVSISHKQLTIHN